MRISKERLLQNFADLINTPSVVGYYPQIDNLLEQKAEELGYKVEYDKKHTAYIKVKGENSNKVVCFGAHLDTIGMIVRTVDKNGWIQIKNLGGVNFNSLEGENVYIHTRNNKTYTGLVIHQSHSVHVFDDAKEAPRDIKTMRILLDEDVHSDQEVYDLGIEHGDLVSVEPRLNFTNSGYIKSRHIDDKIHVAALLEVLAVLKENSLKPAYDTWFAFPIYEEIGLGGAYIPKEVDEYIALDVGLIGEDYHGDEKNVSIGAADAAIPYDWDVTTKLINTAKSIGITPAVDIFYRYGSDASAGVKCGNNIVPGLFGVACMNTHGYERTHIDGVLKCTELALAYALALAE